MFPRKRCWRLLLMALPLLATGPCLTIAEQATIAGFFNALRPLLVDAAETWLATSP